MKDAVVNRQIAADTATAQAAAAHARAQSAQPTVPVASAPAAVPVVVVVLIDVAANARLWGYARYVLGRWPLRNTRGLRFAKVLGSGANGGFGVRPSGTHQGLFCVFDDDASASAFLDCSALMDAYRAHAREWFSVRLRPLSSRGSWSGMRLPASMALAPPEAPLAALTRASIRPLKAAAFWRHAAPSEASLAAAAGNQLAVGLGEAPLLRQATFTIWDNAAAMDAYARSGAHLAAIRAARGGDYFAEDMFVRFFPYEARGTWHGRRVHCAPLPGA